jgi:putative ABC transport system ATP-binding protein
MNDLDPLSLRRQVGMVFQKPVLFAGTVRDNLAEADGVLDDDAYRAVLKRVALGESFLERSADELSGGEAQRACLARALVASPTALLMDEPTSSLDGAAAHRLEGLAQQLAGEGIPVVWVSHDLDQVNRIADHVVVVIGGAIAYTGAAAAVGGSSDPRVLEFLAGENDAG